MNLSQLSELIGQSGAHTFQSINFGCRVNAAELNQLSQFLVDLGLSPETDKPDVYLVNTCAITKKGEYESIHQIKKLATDFPESTVIATGCAKLDKLSELKNVILLENTFKDQLKKSYSPQIADKFSHTHRYLLKVQSGCSQNCTFCIVPLRRPTLNSITISDAVDTVNNAVANGYQEVVITGVNLIQYLPGLSNLVEALLTQTKIELITFGSVPVLCVDDKFIALFEKYSSRLATNLHIPLQSCSDKILKLMHRPYSKEKIISTFTSLRALAKRSLTFSTDIIVGFPTESEADFQETYELCQQIGFANIHVFKYSPRPETSGRELFLKSEKISKSTLLERSRKMRNLVIK